MKGHLLKASKSGQWSRRYVETNDEFLSIYKSKDMEKLQGVVCLPQASLVRFSKTNEPDFENIQFEILINDDFLQFRAKDEEDAYKWVKELKKMLLMPMPSSIQEATSGVQLQKENVENENNDVNVIMKKRVKFSSEIIANEKAKEANHKPNENILMPTISTPAKVRPSQSQSVANSAALPSKRITNTCLMGNSDLASKFYFKKDTQMIAEYLNPNKKVDKTQISTIGLSNQAFTTPFPKSFVSTKLEENPVNHSPFKDDVEPIVPLVSRIPEELKINIKSLLVGIAIFLLALSGGYVSNWSLQKTKAVSTISNNNVVEEIIVFSEVAVPSSLANGYVQQQLKSNTLRDAPRVMDIPVLEQYYSNDYQKVAIHKKSFRNAFLSAVLKAILAPIRFVNFITKLILGKDA